MNVEIAHKIAEFLNNYNELDIFLTQDDILKEAKNYIFINNDNQNLIGAVKYEKVDWYLGIIKHLTVNLSHRKKGTCFKLLNMSEKNALNQNIRVLQSTIRKNDIASIKCFKKCGYKQINCFFNKRTKRDILIFQKILNPCK